MDWLTLTSLYIIGGLFLIALIKVGIDKIKERNDAYDYNAKHSCENWDWDVKEWKW